jgi:putative salt-induced outer membrane protein
MMSKRSMILCFASLVPVAGMCDDAPPPPQDTWTGKGQAGYVASRGNTDATAANAAIDMAYLDGAWKHAAHVGGLYGQNADIVSAERWDAMWQTNYDVTKDLYTFGNAHYTHDLFSGFEYQATASVGLGYKIFNSKTTQLDAQLGVGFTDLRPENITKDSAGAVTSRTLEPGKSGAAITAGVNYSQALTDTTTLSDKLLVAYSSFDTLTTNTLALSVKVSTKLALSLGYTVTDNSNPPGTLKKLDTLTTVNLVYAF